MRWLKNVACRGDITNGYKILHNKQNNVYNLAYWTLCTFSYWLNILAPVYCLKLEINWILINSYVFLDRSSIYMSFNILHLLYSRNYIKAAHLMHCEHIFQELYILNYAEWATLQACQYNLPYMCVCVCALAVLHKLEKSVQ